MNCHKFGLKVPQIFPSEDDKALPQRSDVVVETTWNLLFSRDSRRFWQAKLRNFALFRYNHSLGCSDPDPS
jgi:hypothetical protein